MKVEMNSRTKVLLGVVVLAGAAAAAWFLFLDDFLNAPQKPAAVATAPKPAATPAKPGAEPAKPAADAAKPGAEPMKPGASRWACCGSTCPRCRRRRCRSAA